MSSMQPAGVQGMKPLSMSPAASLPWFTVPRPSTSLAGDTRSVTARSSILSGLELKSVSVQCNVFLHSKQRQGNKGFFRSGIIAAWLAGVVDF